MKGIELLSLGLIGFASIALVLIWAMFQMGPGTEYGATVVGQSEADVAISNLESTKRTLSEALLFSSHQSALQVAAAGGSLAGERLWWCNSEPDPPEPEEVLWAMSNKTLSLFNIYVNATQDLLEGATVSQYGCAGVYEPGEKSCAKRDSSACEYWNASAMIGEIGIEKGNIKLLYDGNIVGEPKNNRFWWMYYILKKAADENLLIRAIQQGFRATCPGPESDTGKLDAAIEFAIEELESQFDEYVECSFEYECGPDITMACLNYDCAPEFTEELCYDISGKEILGLQGRASARINIECIDYKYEIPSEVGTENLIWRIKAAVEGGGAECVPIDIASL